MDSIHGSRFNDSTIQRPPPIDSTAWVRDDTSRIAEHPTVLTPDQFMAYATPIIVAIAGAVYKWDALRTERRIKLEADLRAGLIANKMDIHAMAKAGTLAQLKFQQNQIHSLVNSSVQELKRLYMIATNRLARMTHTEEDLKLASDATIAYNEHVERQAKVDTARDIGAQIARGELTATELEAIVQQLKHQQALGDEVKEYMQRPPPPA